MKILIILVMAAVSILVWLLFSDFDIKSSRSVYTVDKEQKVEKKNNEISIKFDKKSNEKSIKPTKSSSLKLDKKVKYYTTDSSGRYEIYIVDNNPENLDIRVKEHNFYLIKGSIDGKSFFVLKIPKETINSEIDFFIVDRHSGKKVTLDTNFLMDLPSLERGSTLKIEIDTKNSNVESRIDENTAMLPIPSH